MNQNAINLTCWINLSRGVGGGGGGGESGG